jgi:hypothetical protein
MPSSPGQVELVSPSLQYHWPSSQHVEPSMQIGSSGSGGSQHAMGPVSSLELEPAELEPASSVLPLDSVAVALVSLELLSAVGSVTVAVGSVSVTVAVAVGSVAVPLVSSVSVADAVMVAVGFVSSSVFVALADIDADALPLSLELPVASVSSPVEPISSPHAPTSITASESALAILPWSPCMNPKPFHRRRPASA